MALYISCDNLTYFDSFGVKHIPKEIKKFIQNKNMTNIYKIHAYNSVMQSTVVLNLLTLCFKLKVCRLYQFIFSQKIFKK